MSYAKKVLHSVAKEMGKEPSNMDRFVDLLEQNMCDTHEALKSTTVDELIEIGIPKLVALKIKKRIDEPETNNNMIIEEKFDKPVEVINNQQNDVYSYLDTHIKKIYDNYLTADEKIASLEVLLMIVKNLLSHPEEAKYRSLKKNNTKLQTTLWKYLFVEQLFIMLGFKYDSETNSLIIPENRINLGSLIYLNDLLSEEIEFTKKKPKMDPYKAGFSSTNPNFDIVEVGQMSGYENSKFQDQLAQLKKEREQILKQHKISQVVKVYRKNGNIIPTDNTIDEDQEDKEVKQFELNIFRKKVAEFQDNFMKDISFSNARKKEFEEFLKQPLHLDTMIKIKLPNEYVIEANFASNQLFKDIFALLDQYLLYTDDYYLYIAPNVKKVYEKKDSNISNMRLCDLGMVPDAVLTLRYSNQEYNKADVLLKNQN